MEVGAAGVMHAPPMNANALPESSCRMLYVVRQSPPRSGSSAESGLTMRSNFGHDAGQNMGLRICTTDSEREEGEERHYLIFV